MSNSLVFDIILLIGGLIVGAILGITANNYSKKHPEKDFKDED